MIAVSAVVYANFFAEVAAHAFDDLCGECNFGQQEEYLLATVQRFTNQLAIHFRFAAGGDTVK